MLTFRCQVNEVIDRAVPKSRVEIEQRLRDLSRSLSDDDMDVAVKLVEVLASNRRR